ncbi:MAG: TetR/AcrR family transcriptional regulator [Gordonia sp. (in: high G+C Gram-positive bacteria)]|uniref:TetR/AcrR family transcriptional regulator n=1 Tax=Gordonia sp. (in: high G+C Gram-positive bacteria) TaxID=84139 RepID=UPI003BB65EC5
MTQPRDPATKRHRVNTQRRLLEAAFEVFSEIGFGHTTVEKVSERAGFTRGAFYSNFASLEELFLAMWAERSEAMIAEMRTALDRLQDDDVVDLSELIGGITDALPLDERWWGITAEVNAHALRTPGLRDTISQREDRMGTMLMPVVGDLLARVDRTIPDPAAFARALIAVFDGTAMRILLAPDDPELLAARRALFQHVVEAYSVPADH